MYPLETRLHQLQRNLAHNSGSLQARSNARTLDPKSGSINLRANSFRACLRDLRSGATLEATGGGI